VKVGSVCKAAFYQMLTALPIQFRLLGIWLVGEFGPKASGPDGGALFARFWIECKNSVTDNSNTRPSKCFGLPIGPIRLDYGYPIQENSFSSKSGQFQFSVGYQF
jgi:hypothetical protein